MRAKLIFVIYIFILLSLQASPTFSQVEPQSGDQRIFTLYQKGLLDSVRTLLRSYPENDATTEFFRGVFEADGERARFHYDKVLALWPNSEAESWALDRLWLYHWSKGNIDQARKYFGFLETRHPDHSGLKRRPDFSAGSGLEEFDLRDRTAIKARSGLKPVYIETNGKWRVQVGAFSKESGARKIADRVSGYGSVDFVEKNRNGKKLTLVMVGRCASEREAKSLAHRIHKETGIEGRVISCEN